MLGRWRWFFGILFLLAGMVIASDFSVIVAGKSMLASPLALLMLVIFSIAYLLVIFEERTGIEKSKPMIFCAGLLWVLAALLAYHYEVPEEEIRHAVTRNLDEFAELFLFLIVALIYIRQLEERRVFEVLKNFLISRGLNYLSLFWLTGVIAFFLSAVADNLTTALVMGAVVMAVGRGSAKFTALACINLVVACNAGGAFSPFGDITTLMVWQAGKVEFFQFLKIFLPSLVSFVIPAVLLSFALPSGHPHYCHEEIKLKPRARMYCGLFGLTIVMAVSFEQILGLPPYLGMMSGLSLLMLADYIRSRGLGITDPERERNLFSSLAEAEWDTLMFFFGVMYCVGALGFIGYLEWVSIRLYEGYGADIANITAGLSSAVIDNIPVMFAILQMDPEMGLFHWLQITLCTGIGGSLMSIGSAAGVALMGTSEGRYTFFSHLRWSWAILIGYAAALITHSVING